MPIPDSSLSIFEKLTAAILSYHQQYNLLMMFSIIFLLPCLIFLTTPRKTTEAFLYTDLFPQYKYTLDFHNPRQLISFFITLACFFFYIALLYNSEMSFWKDFDSIHWLAFFKDFDSFYLMAPIDRFFPLGHTEWMFFYCLSTNLYLLNIILILQLLFCSYLLYRLLDYISLEKRFLSIAVFILLPSVFSSFYGHVFVERNSIMFLLLAALSFKKFSTKKQTCALWFCIFFLNLFLYYKEINILFVVSLLIYSGLYNLSKENITLSDLYHPLRLIRKFPLEFMLIICCFTYTVLFDMLVSFTPNKYVSLLENPTPSDILRTYMVELAIFLLATCSFIKRLILGQSKLWPDCLFTGASAMIFYILYKRILHWDPYLHKAYLLAPASVANLIYIATTATREKLTNIFFACLLLISVYVDYTQHKQEHGPHISQAFSFLSQIKPQNIYLDFNLDSSWFYTTIKSGYNISHPEHSTIFKTYCKESLLLIGHDAPLKHSPYPAPGDIYVHYKLKTQPIIVVPTENYRLLYSNPIISVYEVK